MLTLFARLTLLFLSGALCLAAVGEELPRAGLRPLQVMVDGVQREALVYAPATAKTAPAPLVFVWHGHGGNPRNAERSFPMDRVWPEAISVYPAGLKTPGQLTDPQGERTGWQARVGAQEDRDLKFFDALLGQLRKDYRVDPKRIYSTGHSNGGGFTYLLWSERGDAFAAMAPCGAVAAGAVPKLKPKPVLHIAGEQDPLVKFAWQQRMMNAVRRVNGCSGEGKPWAENCTLYESAKQTPVVCYVHPGGHVVPQDAAALVARFFKEHVGSGDKVTR